MLGRKIWMFLEVRQETEAHFLVGTVILWCLSIFKKSQASSPFEPFNSMCLSRCQRDVIPPVQMIWRPTAFSRVSTGNSDIFSFCEMKTSLHSSHFREIRPYFFSGNLGIHSTWGIKHRVPLRYLLLREGSSWGACGKLAYQFNRILGISSLLETIWGAWGFPRAAVLKLIFI